MKLSIRQIARESDVTWHPLTQMLQQVFMKCYEDSFIQRLSSYNHYRQIPQTVYVLSRGVRQRQNMRRREVNDKVEDFYVVAGVFNPFFDMNYVRNPHEPTVFIELKVAPKETEETFQHTLIQFILADFFKAVCTGNMKKIARSFAVIAKNNEHSFNEPVQAFFESLTKTKFTGENYTAMLGLGRDILYKQK